MKPPAGGARDPAGLIGSRFVKRLSTGVLSLLPIAVAATLLTSGCGSDLAPLESSPRAGKAGSPAPEDAIILNATQAEETTAPFTLHEDPAAVRGVALVLMKGAGSADHSGRARLPFNAPAPGTYSAWAHVLWRDSCSNSLTLRIDNSPERMVGEDALYGTWHWVKAGQYELPVGRHSALIREREDGTALDQLLLTRDAKFMPVGAIGPLGEAAAVRRFADDFARSPGHGLEAWDVLTGKWEIAFSLDPNRIPNQYSLIGESRDVPPGEAAILLGGSPWKGCRLSFSLSPLKDGRFGAVLGCGADGQGGLCIGFELAAGRASLDADGTGLRVREELGDAIRLNQWHRVVVERWAWVVRVIVDDRTVVTRFDAQPQVGRIGFFVASGAAAFDDVEAEEIPWLADDGHNLTIPWRLGEGAKWFRSTDPKAAAALIGHRGAIRAEYGGMPVEEVFVEEQGETAAPCTVRAEGLRLDEQKPNVRLLRRPIVGGDSTSAAALEVAKDKAAIHRVAIRFGMRMPERYLIGPYHFTHAQIEDPSDYLDFTAAEYERIRQSPDADKLLRERKFMSLLGQDPNEPRPWLRQKGAWGIQQGVLVGNGPDAVLRHGQEIISDVELRFRFRLLQPSSVAEVELYGGSTGGMTIRVADPKVTLPEAADSLRLNAPGDGSWHNLLLRATSRRITAQVDKQAPQESSLARRDGGRVSLKVAVGSVEFDDVEFALPRRSAEGFLYAFDRRETDWWREGDGWVDHAGITCVLASNWISLLAPDGQGMLWNKRALGPNLQVAFDVQENSEWFGWNKSPQHLHYPYDNVCIVLADARDPTRQYRLEFNSQNHSRTVLYRNGKTVVDIPQGLFFPMYHTGGGQVYHPRTSRICLTKRGPLLQAIANGKQVFQYEDPDPIEISRLGIGGYKTRFNLSHIEVRTLLRQGYGGQALPRP